MARPSTIISPSLSGECARSSAIRISRSGMYTAWRPSSSNCVWQTAYRCFSSGYSATIVSSPMQRSMNSSALSFGCGVGIGTRLTPFINRLRVEPADRYIATRHRRQVKHLGQCVRRHDATIHELDQFEFRTDRRVLEAVGLEDDFITATDLTLGK